MVGPSGPSPRRRPLLWGGAFSGIGSVTAILISGRLFSVFTPQSILRTAFNSEFVLAILVGATIWVLLATLLRLPVSTTHAILGATVVQGLFLFGLSGLNWDFLALRVLLPMAGGPLAALIGVYLFERLIRGRKVQDRGVSRWAGLSHWGSAAATAFARGVNDAPKIAVLGVFFLSAYSSGAIQISYLIVALAVFVGSLVLGHRVAVTLSGRTVPLDYAQRLRAGVATAALVSAGAYLGAPLSMTHVHEGATAGVTGLRETIRSALRSMVLPWLVTLPVAGLLAAGLAIFGPMILSLT